jgi:hypothetical protein
MIAFAGIYFSVRFNLSVLDLNITHNHHVQGLE